MTKERGGRGPLVAGVAILIFGITLFLYKVFPWLTSITSQGASQEGASVSEESQTDDSHQEPSSTYEANVPFDLTGIPMPESGPFADGDYSGSGSFLFDAAWEWNGTMRMSVSRPVLYDSLEEAGYVDEGSFPNREDFAGCRVVVVDVTVENIDATCKQSVLEYTGVPSFNTSMFFLESSLAYGVNADAILISAPRVEGISYGPERARSYTWVEQGGSITIRMGYFVTHDETLNDAASTVRKVDDTGLDPDYVLVLEGGGWRDGAPVVLLGKATAAGEGGRNEDLCCATQGRAQKGSGDQPMVLGRGGPGEHPCALLCGPELRGVSEYARTCPEVLESV